MKQLLGKAQDPAFWASVREDEMYRPWIRELLTRWESEKSNDIPLLTYSAFRRYALDGDRNTYEKPYFIRRCAMNTAAVLALIYPEQEEYLARLMDLIYAICDEYTWCLPAHQPESDKNNNCYIDLFAAETGMCLSEIYTLLSDRLEPLIADRIRVEVDRRIIRPFTAPTHYWWETSTNNWAAVCAGSVSCTVMLMRPDLMPSLEDRFCTTMNIFLSGFGPDGVCEEGFHYWTYGFGFFTVWADMIRNFTDGRIDFFRQEQTKRAAPFLSRMYLSEGCTVSFSDSGQSGFYTPSVLHYLKNEYPDTVALPDPAYTELMDGCGRWCYFLRNFTWLKAEYLSSATSGDTDLVYYAPSPNWLIVRKAAYGFAAKGGHNAELHNQHDVGSFILAKNGRQMLTDPGRGVYTRQYFTNERYTYVSCGSHGHSVPYFGTDEDRAKKDFFYGYQKDGADFRAKNVSFDPATSTLTMDLAPAYGEAFVHQILRRFTLDEAGFTLRDEFHVDDGVPVTERIVSMSHFQTGEGWATTDLVTLTFDPTLYQVTTSTGDFQPKHPVYFLDLRLKAGVTACEIRASVQNAEAPAPADIPPHNTSEQGDSIL